MLLWVRWLLRVGKDRQRATHAVRQAPADSHVHGGGDSYTDDGNVNPATQVASSKLSPTCLTCIAVVRSRIRHRR